MSNSLVGTTEHFPVTVEQMSHAMKAIQNEGAPASAIVLNLPSRTGKWTIGRDQEALPTGAKVMIEPESLEVGWVAWMGGKPAATSMVSMLSGEKPEMPTADENGDPLPTSEVDPKTGEPKCKVSPQYQLAGVLEGGLRVIIRGGSIGLRFAIENLLQKMALRVREGASTYRPVVELGVSTYVNGFGKQYPPRFDVVGWM